MKFFSECLRENAMKIINFDKKKMKLLTIEQQKSYENGKIYCISEEILENKCAKDKKNITMLGTVVIIQVNTICNLKHSIPKEIPIVFHKVSNYEKVLGEFEGQFTFL